jgi:ribosome biogenesis protein BMS1
LFLYFAILDDETENTSKWKESLLATLSRRSASLMQRVYEPSVKLDSVVSKENDDTEANSSDDEFFVPKGQKKVQVCCLHGL